MEQYARLPGTPGFYAVDPIEHEHNATGKGIADSAHDDDRLSANHAISSLPEANVPARILIVEDQSIVASDVANQLRNVGYGISGIALSGEDAVRLAAAEHPDLALVDIELGNHRFDGIDVAQELRERLAVPVIYVTAYSDQATLERAKVTEPFGYILKPFDVRALQTSIELTLYKHRMEKRLRDSETLLRAIVEDQTEFICRCAPDGRLTFLNQAYARYLNQHANELLGAEFMGLVAPEQTELVRQHFAMLTPEQPRKMREHEVQQNDGSTRWQQWTDHAFFDERGVLLGYQSVGRDITESKRSEAIEMQLAVERERNKILAQLLNDVSHDLMTPLTVIKTSLYLVNQVDANRRKHFIDVIESQVDKLQNDLRDVLDLSGLDQQPTLRLETIDVNELIQDMIRQNNRLLARMRHRVEFNPVSGLHTIEADRPRLLQALNKIYENAIHYTPTGGTITVTVSQDASATEISVADTGMGIAPADLPFIFERFFRVDKSRNTETGRLGLGLPIADKVVRVHGGQIDVESALNKGSTFHVILPRQ